MLAQFGHQLMTALRGGMVLGTVFSAIVMFLISCFLPLRFQSVGFVVALSLSPVCGVGIEAAIKNPKMQAIANRVAAAFLAPVLIGRRVQRVAKMLLASVKRLPLRLRLGFLLVTLSLTLVMWLACQATIARFDAQMDVLSTDKVESKNEVNPREPTGT